MGTLVSQAQEMFYLRHVNPQNIFLGKIGTVYKQHGMKKKIIWRYLHNKNKACEKVLVATLTVECDKFLTVPLYKRTTHEPLRTTLASPPFRVAAK